MATLSTIKYSLIFLLLISIFCSCHNLPKIKLDNSLKIKLHNNTGYRIDSTTIAGKYVGSIEKDAFIFVDKCDHISMQGGNPWGCLDGKIRSKKRLECFELCGTAVAEVSSGTYDLDILSQEFNDGYVLKLVNHRNTSY